MFARIRQPGLVLIALVLAMAGTACALHEDLDQYPFKSGPSTDGGGDTNFEDVDDSGPQDADMAPVDIGPDLDMSDMEVDMTDMEVDMTDMEVDMTDMEADMTDMEVDMTDMGDRFGMVCPGVDPGPLDGNCDPVEQTVCPAEFACAVTVNTGTDPVSFERGCVNFNAATWIKEDGEPCGGSDRCVRGLHCVSGTCRKYCELENARGCEPNEYCTPITPLTAEIGACDDAC